MSRSIGQRSIEYMAHYHHERVHQGIGSRLIRPVATNDNAAKGEIRCRSSLTVTKEKLTTAIRCYRQRRLPDPQSEAATVAGTGCLCPPDGKLHARLPPNVHAKML